MIAVPSGWFPGDGGELLCVRCADDDEINAWVTSPAFHVPMPRECEVPDCDPPAAAYSLCWTHAGRYRRNGSPLTAGKRGGHTPPAPCEPPDPRPVRALRLELERLRAQDVAFAFCWSSAIPRRGRTLRAQHGASRTIRSGQLTAIDHGQ
jgi:hypothetical protein